MTDPFLARLSLCALSQVSDLKNNYSLIYDMILKNMDKIVKAQEDTNYQSMY